MSRCPNLRGDPTVEYCALAEQQQHSLERTRDGIDRILALIWEAQTIAARLAAACTDPDAVADWVAWNEQQRATEKT